MTEVLKSKPLTTITWATIKAPMLRGHCKIRNETHRRDAENAELRGEKGERKYKNLLFPRYLCDLRASAVQDFTVPLRDKEEKKMRNLGIGLVVACLTLCLYVVAQADIDPSLVLYFDFESGQGNTVEDRSIYGNDGNVEGNAKWGDGRLGKGLEIDLNSFIIVPDCDEFKITDELTLACWAKSSAFAPEAWQGNSLDFLVCRWNWAQGDNRCYEMFLRSHIPAITASSDGTDGGATRADAEEPVELDQWYNMVGVFDGSKLRIYVDGEEKGSEDHAGNIFAGEGPIIIGDNNLGSSPDFHFVGVIDEVAVYNRALNQSEIKQKMAQGHTAAAVKPEGKLAKTWGDIKIQR